MLATTALCRAFGPHERYDIGLKSLLGDGVVTRMKSGIHFYGNWIPRRFPEAVIRERVRKLGMDVWMSTRSYDRPPFVFMIYYLLIIQLFLLFTCELDCLQSMINFTLSPSLHIIRILCNLIPLLIKVKLIYKHTFQMNGRGIRD